MLGERRKTRALAGLELGLKERAGEPLAAELDAAKRRIGELSMENELLRSRVADHVPDRYRHTVRYFGLLAPRVKCQTHDTVFALVGQERRGKPRRLRWSTSLQKCFGVDPLVDRNGQRMRWARRVPPGEQN